MFFRATARSSLAYVRREQSDALDELLRLHVPDVVLFKHALIEHGALVSGLAALHVFLRLRPPLNKPLEVYVSYNDFHSFRDNLLLNQSGIHVAGAGMPFTQGLVEVIEVETIRGKLHIFRSTGHAVVPIIHAPNTALVAYISPEHFGLGWPKLTLNLRCMPGQFTRICTSINRALDHLGFDTKLWPWMWKGLGIRAQACARHAFCCPAQQRLVVDKGFMRATMSPLETSRLEANVAFRLCDRPCRGSCYGPSTYLSTNHTMFAEY